jgi:hypothetical protein
MLHTSWLYGLAASLLVGCAVEMSDAEPAEESTVAQDVTLGARTNENAAVAVFNGRVFMTFIGTDSDNKLNIASSADGLNFGASILVRDTEPANSHFSPAITAFNGRIFVAWASRIDLPSARTLQIISSPDGTSFSPRTHLTFDSSTGPALGVANGKLYLAWTGNEPSHPVKVATSTDGINFSAPVTINITNSSFPPALFGAGNVMYVAFAQPAGGPVFILSAPGDLSFGATVTAASSSTGAGLGGNPGVLDLASSNSGQQPVLTRYLITGNQSISLLSTKALSQRTVRSPSVTELSGSILYFWTGTNSNRNINVLRNP